MVLKMKSSESLEQQKFIQWCELSKNKYKDLDLIYAIPNGGSRHKLEAIKLKREGVKSGVPDLHLPKIILKYEYYGLYIEMKYGKNKTSKNQDEYIRRLKNAGYIVKVCYGFDEAKEVIEKYYGGKL